MRGKHQLESFEEYTNKTDDAWLEDDDDVEKIGERLGSVVLQEPTVKIINSGDIRTGILSRIKKKHHHHSKLQKTSTDYFHDYFHFSRILHIY